MIKFKESKDVALFTYLHPALIMIFADLYNYTYETHGVKLIVTQTVSTLREDRLLHRKSSAHLEKRAIDIRTRGLEKEVIKDIVSYVNNKKSYSKYRYLSQSGKSRLAYWHVGSAEHIHLAIHSKYKDM